VVFWARWHSCTCTRLPLQLGRPTVTTNITMVTMGVPQHPYHYLCLQDLHCHHIPCSYLGNLYPSSMSMLSLEDDRGLRTHLLLCQ
jgi:hypothetical protein